MAKLLQEYNTIDDEYCNNESSNNRCWFIGHSSYYCREFHKHLAAVTISDCEMRRVRLPECLKKFKENITVKVYG